MVRQFFLISALFAAVSCGGRSSSSSSTPTALASAIESISEGVEAAGNGMEGNALTLIAEKGAGPITMALTPMASSLCSEHGDPLANPSDAIYPFTHTYCGMTMNAGDTVRGGFSLAQSLICSLERGGVRFEGSEQSIEIDFDDTTCWPDGGPEPTNVIATATGSAPASFNSYFEKGVIFTVENLGLTFKIAANISATSIEFIANETWADGNKGVMAGKLDKTTGVLQFEKRDERIRASCDNGSCGWNRHTRIYASLDMVGGKPAGLNSLSYGFSDFQVADPTDAVSAMNSGKVITAEGSLSTGIKARIFGQNGATVAQMKVPGNWVEDVSTGCMTSAGYESTSNCTGEPGIAKFTTDTKFGLFSGPSHTSPDAWLTGFEGFSFTSVSLNVD